MVPYILAIHIIFVVCWFAALFYIVRLFIYHTEAQQRSDPDRAILSEQFEIMERRLWNFIAIPSMIVTLIAGVTIVAIAPSLLQQHWLQVKLCFVAALLVYHFICQQKIKEMRQGVFLWTSTKLRIWNETATILLFAIVFLAVLKNALSWIYALAGMILFAVALMFAVKLYKYHRLRGHKKT